MENNDVIDYLNSIFDNYNLLARLQRNTMYYARLTKDNNVVVDGVEFGDPTRVYKIPDDLKKLESKFSDKNNRFKLDVSIKIMDLDMKYMKQKTEQLHKETEKLQVKLNKMKDKNPNSTKHTNKTIENANEAMDKFEKDN